MISSPSKVCQWCGLTVLFAFFSLLAQAQADSTQRVDLGGIPARPIQLTVFDYPMNLKGGYYWPSFQQSIHVTKNMHQVTSKLIGKALEPIHPTWGKVATFGGIFVFNAFQAFLPTGLAWQHQEAHRVLLRYRDVKSFNQSYEIKLFSMRLATKDVLDEDLVRFKRDYPQELNRLRGAGHEGQSEMSLALKKDAFYYDTPGYYDIVPIFANTFVIIQFLNEWRNDDYDQKIDLRNQEELTIAERDISGVEFTPWVYDLFRPNEPYDQRGENGGVHEYGVGIDRYIGNTDLTAEEAAYLKKQSRLVWLCAVSPQLFGIKRFKATSPFNQRPFYFNFNVIHNLNSFGHVIDINIFLKQDQYNLFVNFHNYKNKDKYFPGLDVEMIRYPVKDMFFSGTLGMWIQPQDQDFLATKGTPGGWVKLKVDGPISNRFEWFVEADAKTAGWVAGVVALEPYAEARTGLNWRF